MAGVLSHLQLSDDDSQTEQDDDVGASALPAPFEEQWRRQCWEAGNIDYRGRDSFDNIWNHIKRTLNNNNNNNKKPTPNA